MNAMSCRSSVHVRGLAADFSLNVQFSRPSFRRSRSTDGLTSSIDGMTMRRSSSGSAATSKPMASSVAKSFARAQSGFAITMLRAVNLGHGTHARHPCSNGGRCQSTRRSPLIENCRPMASDTLSSIHGRARFQSNVWTKTASAPTTTATVTMSAATILPNGRAMRIVHSGLPTNDSYPAIRVPACGSRKGVRPIRLRDRVRGLRSQLLLPPAGRHETVCAGSDQGET